MSKKTPNGLPFYRYDEIQEWADTHTFFWESESREHTDEVIAYLKSNSPVPEGSGFDSFRAYMNSDTSGQVILEFDTDEMTEADAAHLQQWMQEFPSNSVSYQPMMGLGGVVRVSDDDPEVGLDEVTARHTIH